MRYLSKVTFINSAHIHFGEVELNGNVHFTGTQGVGKSTLLRAILFFYNADKMHLGIRQQDQRTFDDFYLPHPTSYIVYEVERGGQEGVFSILVFRHKNRAAFRFVDAPFDSAWLINENGVVTSNPTTVGQRIRERGHDHSRLIEHYEHYRDILYGNRHGQVKPDERKYHLLESTHYQNIPRIIQNVFLNERVDAGFIKDTIIRSLNRGDEEACLDLQFYRSQLADFTDEYEDIALWTRKNKRGEVEVQVRAEALTQTCHAIKALRINLEENCAQLNFAMKHAEQRIPVLRKRCSDKREQLDTIDRKQNCLKQDYENKREKLNQNIGMVEGRIHEAHRKLKEYRQMGIEDMLARASKEQVLLTQKAELETQIATFEKQYDNITAKYRAMKDRLEIERHKYVQAQNETFMNERNLFYEGQQERLKQRDEQLQAIDEEFKQQREEAGKLLETVKDRLHELALKLQANATSHPLKQQTEEAQSQMDELKEQSHHLEKGILEEKAVLKGYYQEVEHEEQRIREAKRSQADTLERAAFELRKELASEDELLENVKGSFCEWLDAHVPDWTDTIGKVVDERGVLYHTALSPTLSDSPESPSLYGVNLDLSEIEHSVRTPRDIEAHRQELAQELDENGQLQLQLKQLLQKEIEEMAARWDKRIRPQKEKVNVMEQQQSLIPQKLKEAQLRLDNLQQKEEQLKQRTAEELGTLMGEARVRQEELRQQLDTLKAQHDNRAKQARKKHKEAEDEAKSKLEKCKRLMEASIQAHEQEMQQQLEAWQKQMNNELANEGAETKLLDALKQKLQKAMQELQLIHKEAKTVSHYSYDREQLFDRESEFKTQKDKLTSERDNLQRKFEERQRKWREKRQELDQQMRQEEQEAKEMADGLAEAKEYVESENCPTCLHDVPEQRTTQSCSQLVKDLMQGTNSIHAKENRLKETANAFRSMFSERNTFKFPTLFNTTADYMAYAESVDDFVSNNKIADVQHVTSSLYTDVMARISRDFNDLVNHESEIRKVVADVNYDFTQRSFAGVIRGMELKLERSQDALVSQLAAVCDFWTVHQMDLGEANLFSSDNRDTSNKEAVKMLQRLTTALRQNGDTSLLTLSDTFSLKFKIEENDNSTGWIDNIRMVGSDGTDILVKAILNILLISVFKQQAGKSAKNCRLHCMMDEIGKLADENIQGILNFANERNIFVVNSSPKAHRPLSYRHLYVLSKDRDANTIIRPILSTKQVALEQEPKPTSNHTDEA